MAEAVIGGVRVMLFELQKMSEFLLGWPLLVYVLAVSVVCTIAFSYVQIRYFLYSWKLTLFAAEEPVQDVLEQSTGCKADMTPFQAFINTLSTNLGNGNLAGMATAIHKGGPGAAIWVLIIGGLLMSVRFAEVYLSALFGTCYEGGRKVGGPMLYLRRVRGGAFLAPLYAILCFLFGILVGNAVQANSIQISLSTTWGVSPLISAVAMTLFVVYVVLGGASRVVALSDKIVPLKVILFFGSVSFVLVHHYKLILPSLKLMATAAFDPHALVGGAIGFTVQQAMRYGILRSVLATESGLGTAAVIFGGSESKNPFNDGTISMLSTFISTFACFVTALCIVVTGVWNSSLTSTALTIAAFATTFGKLGGLIVSFLSVTFGIGVLVSYIYITEEAWISLMGTRTRYLFMVVFCAVSFFGALARTESIFGLGDILSALMLVINLFAILCFIGTVRKGLRRFSNNKTALSTQAK